MNCGLRRLKGILLQPNFVRTCARWCMCYRIVNYLVVTDNGKLLQQQKVLSKHTSLILLPRNINILFTLHLVRDHLSFKRGGRIEEVKLISVLCSDFNIRQSDVQLHPPQNIHTCICHIWVGMGPMLLVWIASAPILDQRCIFTGKLHGIERWVPQDLFNSSLLKRPLRGTLLVMSDTYWWCGLYHSVMRHVIVKNMSVDDCVLLSLSFERWLFIGSKPRLDNDRQHPHTNWTIIIVIAF